LPEVEDVFSMTDDERAIRKLVDTWLAASKAGDLATVLSLMTDDVIFMVPGRKPFGKDAFAAAFEGMRNLRIEGTSDINEIQLLGDWHEAISVPLNPKPVRPARPVDNRDQMIRTVTCSGSSSPAICLSA
jgi:uncharacterized protein (TIGR02246 family)